MGADNRPPWATRSTACSSKDRRPTPRWAGRFRWATSTRPTGRTASSCRIRPASSPPTTRSAAWPRSPTIPNLGNRRDGMLITSTGGNILIRTNVVTENGNDGIEIGGTGQRRPRGRQHHRRWIPTGTSPMGNKNNGVEVDGNANNDMIGGPQPTFNIIPQNTISANGGNGVAIDGTAQQHHRQQQLHRHRPDRQPSRARQRQLRVLLGSARLPTRLVSTDTTLPTRRTRATPATASKWWARLATR